MTMIVIQKQFSDRVNRIETSSPLAVVTEAAKMRAEGAELLSLGMDQPHFSTRDHIKEAGIAAIQNNFKKYPPVAGIPELRRAIAKRHAADFGSDYKPEEAVAATGGKQALFNAIQVLVDHGDEVIIPVPYWVSFKDIVEYAGGKCVYVYADEDDNFRLTAEMIEDAITPRTRAIILNTPCNPSGAVMDAEDLRHIVRLAHERGIYVIADECYVYLNYAGEPFSAGSILEAKEHVVVIGSLSKTYAMTGWRAGYSLAPAPVSNAIQKLQSQSTSNPSAITQKAAVTALEGPQECVQQFCTEYIHLRDRVLKGLETISGIRCAYPEGAFYVYPNVSSFFGRSGIRSAADVAGRLLREAHVVTVPGEGFGTKEHIRLSYATSAREIDRAVERMRDFFAKL